MRQRHYTHVELIRMFRVFGVELMPYFRDAINPESAKAAWTKALADTKLRYRQLAMELHPDRNPDGLERFQEISEVWNALQCVEIIPAQRPIPFVSVDVVIRQQAEIIQHIQEIMNRAFEESFRDIYKDDIAAQEESDD